jgi:hypothetical protein
LDFFTWEIAIAYGFTEAEAGEFIRRIQKEFYRDVADTWGTLTRCPLCKRHGADTKLSQFTLEQFVMNSMGGLRRLSH